MRMLARLALTLALAVSLVMTLSAAGHLATDPRLAAYRDAAASEIVAATDVLLAAEATPERLTERIRSRLSEEPRDWVVIDALADLARERAIDLPQDLIDQLQVLRSEDGGIIATATACGACVMDASTCTVTLILMCRAPIDLTVAGDIAGIARAGAARLAGEEIDEIDLGLSIIGLGATALVLFSGGTSLAVKAGAGLAKTARAAGRLSDGLSGLIRLSVREGVDWARLPAVRGADDLSAAIRVEAFQPLLSTTQELTRLQGVTGTARALHLLPLVDGPIAARRLSNAAEALGPTRLVAGVDLVGPARMLRATVRFSDAAWQFVGGLFSFLVTLALGVVGAVKSVALRLARARLRRGDD
jgi:hypothetical protein